MVKMVNFYQVCILPALITFKNFNSVKLFLKEYLPKRKKNKITVLKCLKTKMMRSSKFFNRVQENMLRNRVEVSRNSVKITCFIKRNTCKKSENLKNLHTNRKSAVFVRSYNWKIDHHNDRENGFTTNY